MNLEQLIFLSCAVLAAVILWKHLEISRAARTIAAQQCARNQLVLLDQSVILERMKLGKSKTALFNVIRQYEFEFSTVGDARYKGRLTFNGSKLANIEMDVFKV